MIDVSSYDRFLQRATAAMAAAGYEPLLAAGQIGAPWTNGWDLVLLGHGPGETSLFAFTSGEDLSGASLKSRIDQLVRGLSQNGALRGGILKLVSVVVLDGRTAGAEERSFLRTGPSIFVNGLRPATWTVDLTDGEIRTGSRLRQPPEVDLLRRAVAGDGGVPDAVEGEVLRRLHADRMLAFYDLMRGRQPVVTYVLVAVNVMIYLLMNVFGHASGGQPDARTLIAAGALVPGLVLQGQWWRLVTAIFLHASVPHILFNMTSLLAVGTLAERLYGSGRFLGIYLGAGLIGSLTSLVFAMISGTLRVPGVGASGAIFGVAGALVTVRFQSSEVIPRSLRDRVSNTMVPLILLSLLFAYLTPYVDNAAHIGGLLGGMVLSLLFPLTKRVPQARG